ncbi:helix-turn-helix domain-containing protein [Flavobacterium columnare]|uniref:Helix-turn-helix domain-containing protein n=1 Tax=Flavobacterium columnare TaxID=996 RepID=A0A437UBF7_9FLAO|nr:helix-turn-helix domain-containing protein [Flavobacterium columnare]RVU90950.1 helix-turn-helix domain-containing protein [Flavobacterium columnare]
MKNNLKLFVGIMMCLVFVSKTYANNEEIYKKLAKEYESYTKEKDKKRIGLQYLNLAKKENNLIEIRKGYKLMANSIEELTSIESVKYADSMILVSKKINKDLLLKAYMYKGILLSGLEKTNEALNLFIKVEKEADDLDLKYQVKLMLAQIRMDDFLEIDESISILEECQNYFKDKKIEAYTITINSLAEAYLFSKNYDSAKKYTDIGIKTNHPFFKTRFELINGMIDIETNNYKKGINTIQLILPKLIENADYANVSLGYYNLGKAFLKTGNTKEAVKYYEKVDSIYQKNKMVSPSFINGYNYLIEYYSDKDIKKQNYYLRTNLEIEKKLQKKYKTSYRKLKEQYDLPNAIQTKDFEINNLKKIVFYGFICIGIVAGFIILRLYRKNKQYEKAFKSVYDLSQEWKNKPYLLGAGINEEIVDVEYEILSNETTSTNSEEIEDDTNNNVKIESSSKLGNEIINDLQPKFENFETKRGFLKVGVTIQTLATLFKTNSKYISLYVNQIIGKTFTEYINDLRIEYAVVALQNNPKLRNYTVNALANEFGFLSKNTFINAFEKKTGMRPIYYINEIIKINKQ